MVLNKFSTRLKNFVKYEIFSHCEFHYFQKHFLRAYSSNFVKIWLGESMNVNLNDVKSCDNITDLAQWKMRNVDNSFSDYLKVLSFNDLINESENLIDELKHDDHSSDLVSKTKLMMNEFTERLEKESRHLALSVIELKKEIENKLPR